MSRNVTLLQIRTDIAEEADIAGAVGVAQRYTPTALNRRINQSIQRFRERISNEGVTHYLAPAIGTLTVGATSPFAFGTIDLSAVSPSVVRTYGIDVTYNDSVISLDHIPFTRRDQYGGPTYTGVPCAWSQYQTRVVAVFPPSDSSYPYTVWYLPVLADLSLDADTFDGVAGWEEWIVYDAICRLGIKNQYPNAFGMATAYRQELWDDILRGATRVSQAGGASVGRDTLARTMNSGYRDRRGRLPPP